MFNPTKKNTMDVNITIIGAGVVGLAIASHLSSKYDNIFVIERHKQFGQETSSRNSEVIHSGIYYPTGSLKAKMCVRGRELLYQTCKAENILFNNCGKLIVATEENELEALKALQQKAIENNVHDLQLIDRDQVLEMEPHISAIKALFSPSTGIIDTHGLMKHFEKTSNLNGVNFAYHSKVQDISKQKDGYLVVLKDADGTPFKFTSSIVINCAGLESDLISNMVGIVNDDYKIFFCKGEYFKINPPKNRLVNRLVYPVPGHKLVGLGIHSTIDLSGGLKLGPSAFYLDENTYDYSINSDNSFEFYKSARKFLPFIEHEDLSPEMAGIRPKIQAPGSNTKDFVIRNEEDKGFPNFINLIGIESPGLTSSMAIAEYVETIIIQKTKNAPANGKKQKETILDTVKQ
jgi:L-2-hydroxyglutarate oxidase LhgO